MTDEHGFEIPIDAHPDPVVAYVVESDAARITATNDAFEATFEGLSTDTPIGAVFAACSVVRPSGDADPETHLVRGDAASIYLDGLGGSGPFLARIVPSGDDTGHLVFADLGSYPDAPETAGVGQVASVISHDLRNPLDVAKAHLRAARETGDAAHFDAVADAHDRMEQIIRDVLTLARGNEVLNVSDGVSIRTAAEDAWESVDTGRATLDVAGTLPTTSADPGRVRRLFENLFRNAVEHGSTRDVQSPNDGGGGDTVSTEAPAAVTVTVGALDDGFYVADDGSGIPTEQRDMVFDPGYTTEDAGAGLGLAIVETVVTAHGWELGLTTAESGGARFEVEFQ